MSLSTPAPSMHRVVVTADGVEVMNVVPPEPTADEALVSTKVVGVCGSDTHAANGRHPFISLPYAPGHEVVGVVESVGADVNRVSVGQRVTVEPDLPCWTCKMCLSGRENICENLRFFGCGYSQGGMADAFTIDANRLHVVPDDFDDLTAALIEPLSTPVHAVGLAGGADGKTIVIIGAGTIGLLMLAAVRHDHAARVVVTDIRADKRERALRLGADVVIDPTTGTAVQDVRQALGESADIVFDCVGIESTVRDAIALASKGGTVVVVGVPAGDVSVPLAVVQDHQIRIQGSATYLPSDFAKSIDILRAGGVSVADIITAQLPLDDAREGFSLSGRGDHVKVVLTRA